MKYTINDGYSIQHNGETYTDGMEIELTSQEAKPFKDVLTPVKADKDGAAKAPATTGAKAPATPPVGDTGGSQTKTEGN